jgi:hypothetical protein
MTALTEQESGWINEVATRLRLIQTDTAQLESEKRCEFLQEEVERVFKEVPPANRQRLLEALLVRFPVAGKVLGTFSDEPAVPAVPPPVMESPEKTLERLLAALPKLSEDQRAGLTQKLIESGLIPAKRSSAPLEISEEALRALGVPAGQTPDLERVVQLAGLLLDVVSRLDQTALKTMEVLAPRSPLLKRNESIRRSAARFLLGEVTSIDPQARELSALLGALLAATLGGGRVFGQQYVERFSPSAIEDVVTAEGGGGMFGRSKKERCWDRYADLARDFATPDLVDRKLKEALAAVVQRTVEKGGPTGR